MYIYMNKSFNLGFGTGGTLIESFTICKESMKKLSLVAGENDPVRTMRGNSICRAVDRISSVSTSLEEELPVETWVNI